MISLHALFQGSDETVRVVALDKDYHIDCYHCEVRQLLILYAAELNKSIISLIILRLLVYLLIHLLPRWEDKS